MLTSLRVDRLYDKKLKWLDNFRDPDSDDYQQLSYEASQAVSFIPVVTPSPPPNCKSSNPCPLSDGIGHVNDAIQRRFYQFPNQFHLRGEKSRKQRTCRLRQHDHSAGGELRHGQTCRQARHPKTLAEGDTKKEQQRRQQCSLGRCSTWKRTGPPR